MINCISFSPPTEAQLTQYALKPSDYVLDKYTAEVVVNGSLLRYTLTFSRKHIANVQETDNLTAKFLDFMSKEDRSLVAYEILHKANAFIYEVRKAVDTKETESRV